MTSADRNDLVTTQEKLWVTPKISLMEAGDTDGIKGRYFEELAPNVPTFNKTFGPS